MKKTILTIFSLILLNHAFAQDSVINFYLDLPDSPVYDTFRFDDPNYLIYSCEGNPPDVQPGVPTWRAISTCGTCQFPTDTAVTIYGMALAIDATKWDFDYDYFLSMKLYTQPDDRKSITMDDSVRLSVEDIKDAYAHRKISYLFCPNNHATYHRAYYQPVLDFYFSHPIFVQDTFYPVFRQDENFMAQHQFDHKEIESGVSFTCTDGLLHVSSGFISRWEGIDGWEFFPEDGPIIPCLYPIIGNPCQRPERPGLSISEEDTTALISWQPHPEQRRMQAVVAPWPSRPDDGEVMEMTDTTLVFRAEKYWETYAVWVRYECGERFTRHADTTWWSDWSEPRLFNIFEGTFFHVSTQSLPTGGGTVSGAGHYLEGTTATLTAQPAPGMRFARWSDTPSEPNPRSVTVTQDSSFTAIFEPLSSEGIEEVERQPEWPVDNNWYDLLGRRVSQPQKGHIYIHNRKKIIY